MDENRGKEKRMEETKGQDLEYKVYNSPVGEIYIFVRSKALEGLEIDLMEEEIPEEAKQVGVNTDEETEDLIRRIEEKLDAYFAGEVPDINDIPLSLEGTDFQKEVWDLLLQIPTGEVRTYGVLARILADRRGIQRMSAQAVGRAVGANPISIFIPCHRVVAADGSLTGYRAGVDIKEKLLEREGLSVYQGRVVFPVD